MQLFSDATKFAGLIIGFVLFMLTIAVAYVAIMFVIGLLFSPLAAGVITGLRAFGAI